MRRSSPSLAIDIGWLGVVARGFCRRQLGFLLADQVNWWAAVLFCLLLVAGQLVFAVALGLQAGSLTRTPLPGGLFGYGGRGEVAGAVEDVEDH